VCVSLSPPLLSLLIRRVHFFGTGKSGIAPLPFHFPFVFLPPTPTLCRAMRPVLRRFAPANSRSPGDLLPSASRQFDRRPHVYKYGARGAHRFASPRPESANHSARRKPLAHPPIPVMAATTNQASLLLQKQLRGAARRSSCSSVSARFFFLLADCLSD